NDRARESLGEVDRRALKIDVASRGIWTKQTSQVLRLKLVRVTSQGLGITNAEVTRAGFECVAKRQRTERRVTTRAAAGDDQPITIDLAPIHQVLRAIHTVVDVDKAPFLVEALAVLPAVAGAATVIDVEHCKSPAGPILDRKTQRRRRSGCWTTVTLHDQWRLFAVRRAEVRILRRIEKPVRRQSCFGWKLDR